MAVDFHKPYSAACKRNCGPILQVLSEIISPAHQSLLEIGSGTGQHAVYLAPHFPSLTWQTSDLQQNHAGIQAWIDSTSAKNIAPPLEYEVGKNEFPLKNIDVVFTANTFHIMPWPTVQELIKDLGRSLKPGVDLIIYGPFKYEGRFTSPSNAAFDKNLRQTSASQGIRSFEETHSLLKSAGFNLIKDHSMPANNQLLHYKKGARP